jgi:putative flippase GtrA
MLLVEEKPRMETPARLSPTLLSLGRYLISGVCSAGVDFLLFSVLVVWRIDPLIAHLVSRPTGGVTCFFLNRYWTFRAREGAFSGQFVRFWCVFAMSLLLTEGLLALFLRGLGLPPLAGKALAEAIAIGFNFTTLKLWTFR